MATRIDRRRKADQQTTQALLDIGSDFRDARLDNGLSLAEIGAAAGISRWQAARIERGACAGVSLATLNRMAVANGQRLSLRAYPDDDPIRDAAHARLLERLRVRLATSFRWRTEVPLPRGGLRAWDAWAEVDRDLTAIEAETRIHDGQALERRLMRKRQDDPRVDRMVLLIADTAANRSALALLRDGLRATFPLDTREVLAAFAAGHHPAASGIAIL